MHDQSIKKISGYNGFFYCVFEIFFLWLVFLIFFLFFLRFLLLGLFFFQVKVGQTQLIQVNLFFNFFAG